MKYTINENNRNIQIAPPLIISNFETVFKRLKHNYTVTCTCGTETKVSAKQDNNSVYVDLRCSCGKKLT